MSWNPGKPSRWGWVPFAAYGVGFYLAGRRLRIFMLAGLACLIMFVAGTRSYTDPISGAGGWELTFWSWLAIVGFVVDLCFYPLARRLDRRDRDAAIVERDVAKAEYSVLVQDEAERRLSASPPEEQSVPAPRHVAPRFEYETDSGLIVRDHRAVDPDEL